MKEDPVCGVMLEARGATAISRYRDRYYYFCSLRCREAFDLAPHRFAQAPQVKAPRKVHRRRKAA